MPHGRTQLASLLTLAWVCALSVGVSIADDTEGPRVGTPSGPPVSVPDGSEAAAVDAGVQAETIEKDPIATWMDSTASEADGLPRKTLRRPSTSHPERRASKETGESKVSLGTDPLSMMWPLLVILVLITAGAVLARKWLPKGGRLGGGGAIKVLNRYYLSSKQSLCLVRLGGRVVLLGITPDRISTLTEISDPEEISGMVASEERSRPGSFTSSLAEFVSGRDRNSRFDDMGESEPAERSTYSVSMETLARTDASVQDLSRRIRALSERNASAESTS